MVRFAPFALLLLSLASAPAYGQGFGVFFGDEARDFVSDEDSCLGEEEVLEALATRGYSDLEPGSSDGTRIDLRASRNGIPYTIEFDTCSGRILNILELPAKPDAPSELPR